MSRLAASAPAPAGAPSAASALTRPLAAAGVASLVLITVASPGATRMFSWPWSIAHATALAAPALLLVLRGLDRIHPLALPARPWSILTLAAAAATLASALASPHPGESLLGSAPVLAGLALFLVIFDALQGGPHRDLARREWLERGLLALLGIVGVASIGCWLAGLPGQPPGAVFEARNPFPLGHSNYTAGLALLMLPAAAAQFTQSRGAWRVVAAGSALLALAMLFTSGSRGGLLGLAALAFFALAAAPLARRRRLQLAALAAVGILAFAAAHPRTRAMLAPPDPAAPPNSSNVQRQAMLTAAWRMGADRPLLGWGPGTTPLVYPRYRAGLEGGAENVLQLHSLPAHLWAEFGGAGIACLLAFTALAIRAAPRHPVAAASLGAYGLFALTDWQLDVPIVAGAVAAFAALLAASAAGTNPEPAPRISSRGAGVLAAAFALAALGGIALFGRREAAPEMNVRALALARDPAGTGKAIALLRESLDRNPHQEIAHFNLGWLLVIRDPAAAERHFVNAARLVPDKGGVYFGVGLARLNQGRRDDAARAFALECLNDPAFATSPWWREPAIAAAREATAAEFLRLLERIRPRLAAGSWHTAQLAPLAAASFGLGRPPAGAERSYRRERTGYPVLMRRSDLPAPNDLFDVRELPPAGAPAGAPPLPPKGWLPSPLLLKLLPEPVPANN